MRLIDADALAKELMHEALGYQYNRVINAPTVDAVPVIRCKDCKHYLGLAECKIIGECGGTNFYCGWAERKEE